MTATVLLLHGQPGGARDWELVVAAIGSRAQVLAPDRPGWNGGRPTGIEGNVDAALARIDDDGVRRVILVGHSFGAAVAASLAASAPERVSALVLVAPSANTRSLIPIDRVLAWPVSGDLLGVILLGGAGLALSSNVVRQRMAAALKISADYLGGVRRTLLRPSAWRTFSVEQRALVTKLPALEKRLGQITAPTTILAGSADPIVPVSSARALAAQIPGAKLIVVPGGDHLLPLRHPEVVAESIMAAAEMAEDSEAGPLS